MAEQTGRVILDAAPQDMRRARRNLLVLAVAQAFLGAQMSILFITGGLIGKSLATNPCLATLPISMIILGNTLSARPLSNYMHHHGRRAGFSLACMIAALGAAGAAWAMVLGSFWMFSGSMLLIGTYMAAQGLYRFAVTDTAPAAFAPKAISWVLAAGLLAALTGPGLTWWSQDLMGIPFLGSLMVVFVLNLLGPFVFYWLDIPRPPAPLAGDAPRQSVREILSRPRILVAIICGMVTYALMNLVMTSTPLAVMGCGFTGGDVSAIVSAHIVAMYLPSFFTGHLITRFGARKIVAAGLVIMGSAGLVALSGVELGQFYLTLILLGWGWNFGYIGATAMLARAHAPSERTQVQGLNDTILFGCVFLASMASGGLMNCSGGSAQTGWSAVNMAMIPLLTLAGAALIWMARGTGETDAEA